MSRAKYAQNQHAVLINCPGCGYMHMVWVKQPEGGQYPIWGFNGNLDSPTIEPSILVNGRENFKPSEHNHRCHSFVRNGRIEFLADCSHALAGQTVDLPEMD